MPRHVQSSAGTIGSFKLLVYTSKTQCSFWEEREEGLFGGLDFANRAREGAREREGKQRNTHSKPNIQMQSWREHKHIESHMHAEKVWRAQGVLQSFFLIGCLLGLASRVWWLWDWKAGQECLATLVQLTVVHISKQFFYHSNWSVATRAMKGLRPKIHLSQWLTMTKGSTPSPKSKLQLRKCQSLRISMSRTKTIKNSYLFLIFLRHSYNLNFREDIQSDEATGGWNRVILSDFPWRVASIQESFQTSLVWCADSADCTEMGQA